MNKCFDFIFCIISGLLGYLPREVATLRASETPQCGPPSRDQLPPRGPRRISRHSLPSVSLSIQEIEDLLASTTSLNEEKNSLYIRRILAVTVVAAIFGLGLATRFLIGPTYIIPIYNDNETLSAANMTIATTTDYYNHMLEQT